MISALRYEWVRIRTVRSTWVLSLLTVLLSGAVAFPIARATEDDQTLENYLGILTAGVQFGTLFMALIGVFAFGHEYRHGTIRATLTAVPQRDGVFLAKAVVLVLWAVVVTLLSLATAWGVGVIALGGKVPDLSLADGPAPRVLLGTGLLVVLWALIGLAYAGLFRNVAAAIVVLLVIPLIVEPLLLTLLNTSFMEPVEAAGRYLPFTASQAVTAVHTFEVLSGDRILPWEGAATFGGFVLLAIALSWLLFRKRDA